MSDGAIAEAVGPDVRVRWDAKARQCVPDPITTLQMWEARTDGEHPTVAVDDPMTLLLAQFVGGAARWETSMRTRNLVRLFRDDAWREIAVDAARQGYVDGRNDALSRWKEFASAVIEQVKVVGTNAAKDPGLVAVGFTFTAIQRFGKNPFAESDPEVHRRLNAWIETAQRHLWNGQLPPPPPEIPADDVARAKAGFMVGLLSAVLSVITDPPSVIFALASAGDVDRAYDHWQETAAREEEGFFTVLLPVVCEPDTFGYNLAYWHGMVDVNTTLMVALRLGEWMPTPDVVKGGP